LLEFLEKDMNLEEKFEGEFERESSCWSVKSSINKLMVILEFFFVYNVFIVKKRNQINNYLISNSKN
jgi:hypothetical protein